MTRAQSAPQWRQFRKLSIEYRDLQLRILAEAVPEEMACAGLSQWARLLSNCVDHADEVLSVPLGGDEESDSVTQAERDHWATLRAHSLEQMKRVGLSTKDFVADAEGLSARERCLVIDIFGYCSRVFDEAAETELAELAELPEADTLPKFISQETLDSILKLGEGL